MESSFVTLNQPLNFSGFTFPNPLDKCIELIVFLNGAVGIWG